MTLVPTVEDLRVEYRRGPALGIGEPRPRLSWRTSTSAPGWSQTAYEVELDGLALGRVDGDESLFLPWPGLPLTSRARRRVRVRVWGDTGPPSEWSEPLVVEAGLLRPEDWSASWITTPDGDDPRPQRFRRAFTVGREVERARLHVTSAGIHELHLNGRRVGDHLLAPGWSVYPRRLRYDTHDVTHLLVPGENVVEAAVADGWWRGHLGWEMRRSVYGDRLGLLAQLEVAYVDAATDLVVTDERWSVGPGPWDAADLYDGEWFDARRAADEAWRQAVRFAPAVTELVSPLGPPVRRIEELAVQEVLTSPSGRTLLDFGQNLVGWVRFTVDGEPGTTVTLRHAEVLEGGELGTRPLRNARATDSYTLRGRGPETWEPSFTFHGFRYAEVDGWPGPLDPGCFTAVVIHSDMAPTGSFTCSHPGLDQLHRNIRWSMRGNAVDVPTDCPQRDERLGWTGDIQVFAPTATFLYDVNGFLADWLEDLRANQSPEGVVPQFVPADHFVPDPWGMVTAAWGDAVTVVPSVLHERYGDTGRLARQLEGMQAWVDLLRRRAGDALLWPDELQLGDWLDPTAPPDEPWRGRTDTLLVATAYFARSAQLTGDAAALLGHDDVAEEYHALAAAVRRAFRDRYVAPSGRMTSDSPTAYALAIAFELYEDEAQRQHAGDRLAELFEAEGYRIATGFVGTPLVLPALTAVGHVRTAYRVLTETACPSWLYPVSMGATTVWERWDSMLPDGSINPGEMTSFNHYALGAVADWMHQAIGGITPAAPAYRRIHIAPVPGRGVTWAACSLDTPYGRVACRWSVEGARVRVEADVPPNTSATVTLPGGDAGLEVTAGVHRWEYEVDDVTAASWTD